MDFESFINTGKLRSFIVEIENIGSINLTELSGDEFLLRSKQAQELIDKDIGENQEHMAWWACRMVKGKNPTKAEVKLLKANYSPSVYVEIYQKGLAYVGGTPEAKEEIEKK